MERLEYLKKAIEILEREKEIIEKMERYNDSAGATKVASEEISDDAEWDKLLDEHRKVHAERKNLLGI